jgi:aspartyl aminopeptidase
MQQQDSSAHVEGFLNFVNASCSPFHAVQSAKEVLRSHGFSQLHERDSWHLKPNEKYFFTRNNSTIFAFAVGGQYKPGNGANIIGAHTDSPNLKVKPVSTRESKGYLSVAVEPYGGGLWHTWFDRDLTVAGRVVVSGDGDKFEQRLVHIDRPILRVPNLAIHLTSAEERSAFKINTQTHLGFPVLATVLKNQLNGEIPLKEKPNHHPLLLQVLARELGVVVSQIRDFELSVCDTQPATLGGALNEFIFSPRIDNLFMSYSALMGLVGSLEGDSLAKEERIRLVTLFDNEEVGSETAHGAGSNMMAQVLTRIITACYPPADRSADADYLQRDFSRTFLISADMAHGVHPNYGEKHDENHQPAMHKGPVIKYNANQRYATTSVTAFLLKELARRHSIPMQEFVVRNDSPCGSTIGPILSANCGIRTIDIGCPQLSMHSIREMCGTDDLTHAIALFKAFFENFTKVDETLPVD